MNKYKIIIVWVLVGCLSISASAQLEFSNWIVGKNTILHIEPDGSTSLVMHNGIRGDVFNYENYHLISDKDGTPTITLGDKKWRDEDGKIIGNEGVNTINYINGEPIYENEPGIWTSAPFMLKSPDNRYAYILHNTFTYEYKYEVETNRIQRIGKTQIRCFCKDNITNKGEDFIIHDYTHTETMEGSFIGGGEWGYQDFYIECPFYAGMSHTDGKSIWILTKSAYQDSLVAIQMIGNTIKQKKYSYLEIGMDELHPKGSKIASFNITDNGLIISAVPNKNQIICIYIDQDNGIVNNHYYYDIYSTSEWTEISASGKYIYFTRNTNNKKRGLYRLKISNLENHIYDCETIGNNYTNLNTIRIGIDGNIYIKNSKSIIVIYDSETDNPIVKTLYTGDDIPDSDIHFPNYLYTYDLFACKSDCDRNASFSFPDPRNEIIAYEWDFGDGAKSTETTPTHQYEEYGSYTVSLKVTLKNGTYKILPSRKIILLDQKPSAQFDNAQVCYGEPLKIILNGNAPYNIFYTFNGENKTITTSDTEYQMDNIAGRYQITKVADQMCETSIKENNTAEILPKLKKITIKTNND